MSSPPGYFKQLWYRYRSLRLPWRRQFLVGADLTGNTFWEFRDALNAGRWRRIVRHSQADSYADVKISPQWHQWLRHTRDEAPSIQEQQFEVSRQERMKQLAAKADERWRSVPSFLDAPRRQQPGPATTITDSKPENPKLAMEDNGMQSAVEGERVPAEAREDEPVQEVGRQVRKKREKDDNPWQRPQQGAPGESWQPGAWSPGTAQRR